MRNAGNTLIVIEHNLDVIKSADWIIDLGPEGGTGGGFIVGEGTPEQIAQIAGSHTGNYLRPLLPKLQIQSTDSAAPIQREANAT